MFVRMRGRIARLNDIPEMKSRVRARGKFPNNIRVAIRADFVSDIMRAGNFEWNHRRIFQWRTRVQKNSQANERRHDSQRSQARVENRKRPRAGIFQCRTRPSLHFETRRILTDFFHETPRQNATLMRRKWPFVFRLRTFGEIARLNSSRRGRNSNIWRQSIFSERRGAEVCSGELIL